MWKLPKLIRERMSIGIAISVVSAACVDVGAMQTGARSYLLEVKGDIECFHHLYGVFPSSMNELVESPCWNRTGAPIDPWGRPYQLESRGGDKPTCRVFSLGRDGKPGGSGPDEDIEFFAE